MINLEITKARQAHRAILGQLSRKKKICEMLLADLVAKEQERDELQAAADALDKFLLEAEKGGAE
jgi:hypothetical protein